MDDQSTFDSSPTQPATDASGHRTLIAGLQRLFSRFDGRLALRLWDGTTHLLGSARAGAALPSFTLVCRTPEVVGSLLLGQDPLRLAEAYFRNEIDVEGDFFEALQLKDRLTELKLPLRHRLAVLAPALLARALPLVTRPSTEALRQAPRVTDHNGEQNREAIAFHYDLSNDFYALWLDQRMVYSCAYFESPETSLDEAQRAKLDHICRKLRLQPGQRMLDIGCGWGALVIHAARHYGVEAVGVTLSDRQLELARRRIADAGLTASVRVECCDYRDLPQREPAGFDRIASVGMFEHVGLKNLPLYFDSVRQLLRPGGVFMNHGITHDTEGWQPALSTEFINRYVFPDGQLDTIGNIVRAMERAGFEIADVEGLRPHYALTLRQWVARLEQHHEQALAFVGEATWRVWRLYMAASALEFETGELGIFQIVATRRGNERADLPLTRRDLYA